MSHPLTQLTKKNEHFIWTDLHQQAFDSLKASESVLAHPRFDQPFILSTDASDYAISAILSQLHDNKGRPISFANRMLNAAERNYSTTQKELLAVVFGTRIHRCFLYDRKFKVVTNHAALKWPITVKNHHCARLTRWVLKLADYDFDIEHKAGKKHVNAVYDIEHKAGKKHVNAVYDIEHKAGKKHVNAVYRVISLPLRQRETWNHLMTSKAMHSLVALCLLHSNTMDIARN
jgi:hypothetical protein